MTETFKPLLDLLAGHSGWIAGAIAWMGAIRLPLKFVSGRLQEAMTRKLAEAAKSPDEEDGKDFDAVLNSRVYRTSAFALDLLFSFKLPTHADYLRAKSETKIN